MNITAEWISALCAGIAIGGGAMKWFGDRQILRRAAIPNVRADWTSGESGHFVTVRVVNRMTEDLRIFSVESKSLVVLRTNVFGNRGDVTDSTPDPTSKRIGVDWDVEAGATGFKSFRIAGANSKKWLRFTASTSAGTFRRLRFVAEHVDSDNITPVISR